jgi:hypothetical protein
MCGVVPTEGANALAVKEWADVAADLVDVVCLLVRYDIQKHGFETDDAARGFIAWLLFDNWHDWPCVSQDSVAKVCHVLDRDAAARLEEIEFVSDEV